MNPWPWFKSLLADARRQPLIDCLVAAALEFHEAKHQALPVTPESNIRWWAACDALDAACVALKEYDATVVSEVP